MADPSARFAPPGVRRGAPPRDRVRARAGRNPQPGAKKPRSRARTFGRWCMRIAVLILVLILSLFAWMFSLRWYTPETTAFMKRHPGVVVHQWVDLEHISRHSIAALVLLEDVEFGNRRGAFDPDAFYDTAQAYVGGDSNTPGGSTLHQQLVKNLYLSSDRTVWRKGVEAVLATPLALTVPDKRVLELYLNYAQLGPDVYGVCAASWYYFSQPPWALTQLQASQLMAVLPLPSLARRAEGGGMYVAGKPELEQWFYNKVYRRVPNDLAYLGGYQAIMEQVGIDDDTSDYPHTGKDACATMPVGVQQLLDGAGVR